MFEEVLREFNDPRRYFVVPGGLRDVHVHFRDPGQPEAETRATGAAAEEELDASENGTAHDNLAPR